MSLHRAVADRFQQFTAALMSKVKVNRVWKEITDETALILKRRRIGGSMVIWLGNVFLSLAGAGISMFVRVREWLDWEAYCAGLLYPDRPAVTVGPRSTLVMPEVRGISLRQLLKSGESLNQAVVSTAKELRRVHQIPCRYFRAGWSHGDLHLDNILYDADTGQATLIDFDTRHRMEVSEVVRRADDLKTVLLELVSVPDDHWTELALLFVQTYEDSVALDELVQQLLIPRGFAKIFWYTRVGSNGHPQIEQRLTQLQKMIHQVASAGRTKVRQIDPASPIP